MSNLTTEQVWKILDEIKDPEIPVVSMVELGLIRQVAVDKGEVRVTMSPTFAGCPALRVMQAQIEERLQAEGAEQVRVDCTTTPPWSSDWITPAGREKLKSFGLAPPPQHGGDFERVLKLAAACPYCGSTDTVEKNSFGPTLCRAIYYCNNCQQPFEQFKPI